jgi:PPM family protein phosphatase
VAGRASTVGAASTHVGKVRDHNEDAHFFDTDLGLFLVCDGMGGHAAGEVASALAIRTIRAEWEKDATQRIADEWLDRGTADARKQLFAALRQGVITAHDAIVSEGAQDEAKSGMGTTLVGAMVVGNELVFAHAGDSRAYLVRDGIAMQLTEDHTLLARLLAAGIDVDVSGEGARFRSMLTNALGIGRECKVATFVVPLADGDRFLLCSDGVSEYVSEAEVGTVLTSQPSPARAAQRLIELALERGGGDNATALVVRVLEAGETPQPADQRRRDDAAIEKCPLWGAKVTLQQRLRALRVAIPRDYAPADRLPAHTLGDRVAWIIVEGKLLHNGKQVAEGGLLYPESLVSEGRLPERESLAIAKTDVRALAIRADDFRELCEDDTELGEALLETLAPIVGKPPGRVTESQPRAPSPSDFAEPEVEPTRPEPRPVRTTARTTVPPPPPPVAARSEARPTTPPPLPEEKTTVRATGTPHPDEKTIVRAPAPLPPPLPEEKTAVRAPPPHPEETTIRRPTPPPDETTVKRAVVPELDEATIRRPAPRPTPAPARPTQPPARAARPTQPPAPAARPTPPPPPRPTQPPESRRTPTVPPTEPPARPTPTPRVPMPAQSPVAASPMVAPRSTPPPGRLAPMPRGSTPPPLLGPPPPDDEIEAAPSGPPRRLPTEPEIEAIYELEAEAPPDAEDDDIVEMTVTVEEGGTTETRALGRTHGPRDNEPTRIRPITADQSPSVSGTIKVPEPPTDDQPRRPKRISEGWDD